MDRPKRILLDSVICYIRNKLVIFHCGLPEFDCISVVGHDTVRNEAEDIIKDEGLWGDADMTVCI